MKRSLAGLLLGLGLVLPACGSTEESPPATTAPPVCIPGQQVACACIGGLPGAQSCKADGSGLGECLCGPGGAGGAAGQASSGAGGAAGQGGISGGPGTGGTAGQAGSPAGQAGSPAGGAAGQGGSVSAGGAAGGGNAAGADAGGTSNGGAAGQAAGAGGSSAGGSGQGGAKAALSCPTEPIVISPYPDPSDLTKKKANGLDPHPDQPFVLDGLAWAADPAALAGASWTWSVAGRGCDAILPHPTFALFNGPVVAQAKRIGSETTGLGADKQRRGLATTPTLGQHQIWPAFTLSGDYQVRGEVSVGGETLGCDVTIRVASPGLRAELCWVMQGDFTGTSNSDLDLHFARLQGNASCDTKHGWFKGCGDAPAADDCFYDCGSGCRTGNTGFCAGMAAPAPGWGYAPSAADACHGWGSLREGQQSCDNPRLDRDNLGCNTAITDPGTLPAALDNPLYDFCGAENINLDQPAAGDQFLVGVHFYSGDHQLPHVNVFCDGHEVLSAGFDPTLSSSPFPVVSTAFNPGTDAAFFKGDFWSVARVEWAADGVNPCVAEPITSQQPIPAKDGPAAFCVDTNAQGLAAPTAADAWLFTPGGGEPRAPGTPASAACWH